MPHKYKGFREPTPKDKEVRCPICWEQIDEDKGNFVKFQGKMYHKLCYEEEMQKPLNERFKRRRI